MGKNSLDTALRVALVGSLIFVFLCVISFGLRENPAKTRPQDATYVDTRHYVAIPPPVASYHQVHHSEPVPDARLASLERTVDALTGVRQHQHLSDQLAQIEAKITQLNGLTGSREQTHRCRDEVETQIAERLTEMSVATQSGIHHLKESVEQLNQSVGGLGGAVSKIGHSVRLLNEQHAMLRQAVEERQRSTTAQVNVNSEQIRSDVTTLVNGMHELKSEIAGLKQSQPPFSLTVSELEHSTSVPAAMPDVFPPATQPRPELTAVSRVEPRPSITPPPVTETESALPLAPGSIEPDQPEPFPTALPDLSAEPIQQEILPQSATVPPAVGIPEKVEPATLELPMTKQLPVPQPATLTPNWSSTPDATPHVEAPAAAVESTESAVQKISLPPPNPIRQMSGSQTFAESKTVSHLPAFELARSAESAKTYRFAATVMHVSADSETATARAGLVRLEDKGSRGNDHAVGHYAMVQKLIRNARRHGSAEVVNSGQIAVTPAESGRLAIGSPCLHCNTVHGVDAGDEVVLTWHDGWIRVHGEAPKRMARVESLPVTEFQPPESATSTTWLISEQAQEGTVSDANGNSDGELEFVQRLMVITLLSSDADVSQLMQVDGVKQEPAIPEIEFREARNSPATFYESTTVPRLLSEESIRDAVRAPKPSERVQAAPQQTRRDPLGLIRSVFQSRKSEETDASEDRRKSGFAARGWARR